MSDPSITSRARRWGAALGALGLTMVGAQHLYNTSRTTPATHPAYVEANGYTTSNACGACHPGEAHSWGESYHRTMTQTPSPASIRAPFDGRVLRQEAEAYRVYQRDGAFWFDQLHPTTLAVKSSHQIALVTGSHHMQAYWFRNPQGRLEQFWWVYVIRDALWMPNEDSFLHPGSDQGEPMGDFFWANGCVYCHTTGPLELTQEPHAAQTKPPPPKMGVAQLGIACETCHGPSEAHVQDNHNPLTRYAAHLGVSQPARPVNPSTLDHKTGSAVCGRCHAVLPQPDEGRIDGKLTFRPGDDFEAHFNTARTRAAFDHAQIKTRAGQDLNQEESDALGAFWSDYTVRIAGREYSGMMESACSTAGTMGCTSCHSMHQGSVDAQLSSTSSDQVCGGCHEDIAAQGVAHTHHAPQSAGSSCINCHMPHTSYGLLGATRSHRVSSPTTRGVQSDDRPNACNLCHLDQTLAWTQSALKTWYAQRPEPLPPEHLTVSAGALWMLRGAAPQRAIAAWHMGWGPTQEASATAHMMHLVTTLLDDDYAAVRHISREAIVASPSYADMFPAEHLWTDEAIAATMARIRAHSDAQPHPAAPALLRAADGSVNEPAMRRWLDAQDDRKVWISE